MVFFGAASDRLQRRGISRMAVLKVGLSLSLAMLMLLAAGVQAWLGAILFVYAFTGISSALVGVSFVFQWGIGAVLRLYPVVDGRYAAAGYAAAFAVLAALQLAAILGLLTVRRQPFL